MHRPDPGPKSQPAKGCCFPGGAKPARQGACLKFETREDAAAQDIVWLEGGAAIVGTDTPLLPIDGEGPGRPVRLKPFGIDRYAVTNRRFASFVSATGFVTEAERFGWSFVFKNFMPPEFQRAAAPEAPWWLRVEGAFWKAPEGSGSDADSRADHPVVHISWNDACAFAAWAGGRLPGEAEWEHAARGGASGDYPWGARAPDDKDFLPCNIWQGSFPEHDLALDGHAGTAPVDAFAPNGFGLFNMAGNTWEWCADAFRVRSLSRGAKLRNSVAREQGQRLMKGGSYLCHASYCHRYRIAARLGCPPDSATGHLGLRVAYDAGPPLPQGASRQR